MILYISGAITGTNDWAERFDYAEQEVVDAGHKAINPVKFHARTRGLTFEQMMSIDLALLDIADGIYMISGWENSAGSNREYGYALAKGLAIYTDETLPSAYGGDSDAV